MQNPLGARKAHTDLLLKRHAFWFAFPSGALMQARQNHIPHLNTPLLVRKKRKEDKVDNKEIEFLFLADCCDRW